jgi:hypothetical protein
MEVVITATRLRTFDPSIVILNVVVGNDKQEWRETFGDINSANTWLLGVRAGLMLGGNQYMSIPELPKEGYKSTTKIGELEWSKLEPLDEE